MATPDYTYEYPTVSGDFKERQYSRNAFGISEVKATNGSTDRNQRRLAAGVERQQRGRIIKETANSQTLGGIKQQNYGRRLEKSGQWQKLNAKATMTGQGVKAIAALNAKIIYTWTGFIYPLQLTLAIISLISLGAAISFSDEGLVATVTNEVVEWVAWLMGFQLVDWQVLFFIPFILLFVFAFISYGFAALQFKFGGAHPFYGESGNSSKQGAFLVGFVCYLVPGLNLFPWIWFWVHAVSKNPH